ncbi:subunit 9 of transcription initiation factor TFIID [Chloropicon roscoffensis]|uniref:Subunit 9 of transcription initiation factor TFIID n=1 Tax=Chloropicon roscoffensis TaxID=1461544 RepID=A0AAX4P5G2_9CHLO
MAEDVPSGGAGVEGGEGGLDMVLPHASGPGTSTSHGVTPGHAPSVARAVSDLLKEMGSEDHEPRVVYQLVEFITTYVHGVLGTAEEYAEHAGRAGEEIAWKDIALALGKSKGPQMDPLGVFDPVIPSGFPTKPNAQLLRAIAQRANSKKLPDITKKVGLSLPQDDSCLTSQNFEVP